MLELLIRLGDWAANWWYIVTPVSAVVLALVVYYVLRARRAEIVLTIVILVFAMTGVTLGRRSVIPPSSVTIQVMGVASDGTRIFVSDALTKKVVVLDGSLRPVAWWGGGQFADPAGMAFSGGKLFVVDRLKHQLITLSAADGTAEQPVGGYGADMSRFRFPNDVAVDSQGTRYIADTGNSRIDLLYADGALSFVDSFTAPGMLGAPRGIGLHPDQPLMYVADTEADQVEVFRTDLLAPVLVVPPPVVVEMVTGVIVQPDGTTSITATVPVTKATPSVALLNAPADVVVDPAGRIYVADTGHQRIAVYTPEGNYLTEYRDLNGAFTPTYLALGPAGTLLVVDASRNRLLVANTGGGWLASVDTISSPLPPYSYLLSMLGGLCLVVSATLATLWVSGAIIADWLGMTVGEGVMRLAGAWAAAWGLTGLFRSFQSVLDGQLQGDGDMRQPGPGVVTIAGASAVAFELRGRISRVSGPGTVSTEAGEVIRAVFDLRPQSRTLDQRDDVLYSREGIQLQIRLSLLYRIQQDEAALVTGGQYQVADETLRRATLNVAGYDWRAQTEQAAQAVLREVISSRFLEQIFDPRAEATEAFAPRAPLQYEIQRRLTRVTERWGVEVLRVTLDEVILPPEVRQLLVETWNIQWHRWMARDQAQTEQWRLEANAELVQLLREARQDEYSIDRVRIQGEVQNKQIEQLGQAQIKGERRLLETRGQLNRQQAELEAEVDMAQLKQDAERAKAETQLLEARAGAEVKNLAAQSGGYAKVLEARGEAMSRIEYIRQFLKLLQDDALLSKKAREDPGFLDKIIPLVVASNPKDLAALIAYFTNQSAAASKDASKPAPPPPGG
jgi:DNA-binding beta-propeller fold protein YncE/regulator of protease activity HflC (stomatin/prohibitin superfamily)